MKPSVDPIKLARPCIKCLGAGVTKLPDLHTELYEEYQRGEYTPPPCPKCHGTGKVEVIDPAWLRTWREAHNVTRKDFAALTGLSYMYVTSIENGQANCTPNILAHYLKIAD